MEAELRDYRRLCEIGIPVPEMLDVDLAKERILKTYIRGDTVMEMVRDDCLPQDCIAQMESMCSRLYAANTNIDYFPTNFVVQDGVMYYIDYECNTYMPEWNFENWGMKYWSKTPEFLAYLEQNE